MSWDKKQTEENSRLKETKETQHLNAMYDSQTGLQTRWLLFAIKNIIGKIGEI